MQRKSDRICSFLTVLCGIPTIVLYLIYYICNFYVGIELLPAVIAVTVIGLSFFAISFRHRLPRFFTRLFCAGLCLYILTFAAFCVWIGISQAVFSPSVEGSGIVLVFGCRTYGKTPGRQLTARLDCALRLLHENPDLICIVSGGQGENETVSEAVSMQNYLSEHGIASERIFIEDQSTSTIENIQYSVALIQNHGLQDDPIIAVSSFYHLPRIALLGSYYQLPFSGFTGAYIGNPFVTVSDIVREYMAYIKLIFVH